MYMYTYTHVYHDSTLMYMSRTASSYHFMKSIYMYTYTHVYHDSPLMYMSRTASSDHFMKSIYMYTSTRVYIMTHLHAPVSPLS